MIPKLIYIQNWIFINQSMQQFQFLLSHVNIPWKLQQLSVIMFTHPSPTLTIYHYMQFLYVFNTHDASFTSKQNTSQCCKVIHKIHFDCYTKCLWLFLYNLVSTDWLTNCMEYPSLEVNSHYFHQVNTNLLWNLMVHYYVHKTPPLVHNLSQMNSVHTLIFYSFKHNYIILSSMSRSLKWSLPFF